MLTPFTSFVFQLKMIFSVHHSAIVSIVFSILWHKVGGSSHSLKMPFNVKVITASPKSNIGTRAHWDDVTQSLFYVDIYGAEASILRYDTKDNIIYTATVDQEPVVSFIIPIANTTNEYAIGIGRRVGIICWDGKSSRVSIESIAFEVDNGKNDTRFNDAKADPSGRFYGGTMRLEALSSLFEIASGTFYRYTPAEDNERVLIDFKKGGKHAGFLPDGMTIDTEGFLYVSTWGASKILKIDPKRGHIVAEIEFPVKQVTSMAFAGSNLDTLYVTTAATNRDGEQPPLSGHLVKVTGLNAKGFPGERVRL